MKTRTGLVGAAVWCALFALSVHSFSEVTRKSGAHDVAVQFGTDTDCSTIPVTKTHGLSCVDASRGLIVWSDPDGDGTGEWQTASPVVTDANYVLSVTATGYALKNGTTGAVTTGTDAGALLQAANDACPVAGCLIQLAAGTFPQTETLYLKSNVTLAGAGQGKTIIYRTSGTVTNSTSYNDAAMIAFGPAEDTRYTYTTNVDETTIAGANPGSNFTIRDLTLDGNSANQTATNDVGAHGINASWYIAAHEFGGYNNVQIRNVEIKNVLQSGMYIGNANGLTVQNCYVHDFAAVAGAYSKNGITVVARKGGAASGYGTRTILRDNIIVGRTPATTSMEGIATGNLSNLEISGNDISGVEFGIEPGCSDATMILENYTIANNVIHDSVQSSAGYAFTWAPVAGCYLNGLTVSGNTVTNMGKAGINIGDARTVSVTGNVLTDIGTAAAGHAIAMSGSQKFTVSGNSITLSQSYASYGIVANVSAVEGVIADNYVHGPSGGAQGIGLCCSSTNVTIANNTVNCGTTGRGLGLRSTATGVVWGNTLLNCSDPVYDDSSGSIQQLVGMYGGDYAGKLTASLTAERTWSLPNASGDVLLSTLPGNAPDVANSAWGVSNGMSFEGAAANAYETTLSVTDPTADRTITLPDATGTILLNTDAAGGAVATARMHASLYGDPNYYTKPAFFEQWSELFRGQALMTDFSGGPSGYKDPIFTIAQCPANSPSSGACTDTTGKDYFCITDSDGDGTAGADLSVGDPLVVLNTSSSSTATPTGDIYYVTAIATGGGAGTDCPNTGNNKKVTVRPQVNYVSESISATGSYLTTAWHQPQHPGYSMAYNQGWRLAFASREAWGAHGRNLLANGSYDYNATRPTGWVGANITFGGAQFQSTPTGGTTYQCFEGEAGTAPYSCAYLTDSDSDDTGTAVGSIANDINSDGTADWIEVEPGQRYGLGAYLTVANGSVFGLYSDINEDSTLEALTGTTTFAFGQLYQNRFYGLPQYWFNVFTIPSNVHRVRVQLVSPSGTGADNQHLVDAPSLRKLTTRDLYGDVGVYAGGTTYSAGTQVSYGGQIWVARKSSNTGHQPDTSPGWWFNAGTFLIGDPGTRNIVIAGDSWVYNDGTAYSNGNRLCAGFAAGMQARLGRDISSQIKCEGRSGETTTQLLTASTCTDAAPTGGAYNCWDRQIARWDPLYVAVNLGTNDVIGSVSSTTYVSNMMTIAAKLQSIGAIPILMSPAPIESSYGVYTKYVSAHAYYTLLRRAVLDAVP